MEKFLSEFKKLPKGIYRLILTGGVLIPLIFAVGLYDEIDGGDGGLVPFLIPFIGIFIIYWILAIVGIWIYQGFKDDKKR